MQVLPALVQVLDGENKLIEELLHLGKEKQRNIKDIEQVTKIARSEQEILTRLDSLEQERHQLFDVIAPGQSGSQWLANFQPQDETEQSLKDLTITFQSNLLDLRSLNQLNSELLKESLALVQFSLNLLTDEGPTTYAKKGKQSQRKSLIDRKV